jgi:hypothetical protein
MLKRSPWGRAQHQSNAVNVKEYQTCEKQNKKKRCFDCWLSTNKRKESWIKKYILLKQQDTLHNREQTKTNS